MIDMASIICSYFMYFFFFSVHSLGVTSVHLLFSNNLSSYLVLISFFTRIEESKKKPRKKTTEIDISASSILSAR